MAEKDYSAQDNATMRREERRYEQQRSKAEALEENCKNTLASLMRQDRQKKAVARDMKDATADQDRLERIKKKVEGGEGLFFDDDEVITGIGMDRPWER
jgi:anti-sigma28 factor (negative regulator of flagellin synthesis)